MPAELPRLQSDLPGIFLHNFGHGAVGEPAAEHAAALADRPKDRAVFYARGFQPGSYCLHWACERSSRYCDRCTTSFLIGLAPADCDAKSIFAELEITDVECDELGTSESAGKSQQENSLVAQAPRVFPGSGGHCGDLIGGGWRFSAGSILDGALNAPQGCFYGC